MLFLIPLLTDFSGLLLIFTVSRQLAELDVGLMRMGLIGGGHALTASLSSYVFGSLSDRIGRKKLVIPGILLLLTSTTAYLVADFGGSTFLATYCLNAMALGMIHPATIAWINRGEAKAKHSYHQYTIQVDDREHLIEDLKKAEIGFGIYYPKPLHHYPHLEQFGHDDLKNSENLAKVSLSLPVHPALTRDDLETVVSVVNRI